MPLLPLRDTWEWLTGVSLVICLGCVAAACFLTVAARDDSVAHAVREMSIVGDGIERQVLDDLTLFDLTLRETVTRSRAGDGAAPLTQMALTDHTLIAKYASFIDILNNAGDVIFESRGALVRPSKPTNFAGRDYFQDQAKNPADIVMIGRPYATAPGQNPAIPVSRRLTGPDGSFAGVAVAGVRLSWLRDILNRASRSTAAAITVRRDDGVILMRSRLDPDDIGRTGTADPAWHGFLKAGVAVAENGAAVHLFRRVGTTPLVLEFVLGREEIVAGERRWISWMPALVLLPGLCVLGLSVLSRRLRRDGDRVAAEARRAEENYERMLVTMCHEVRTPLTGILGQAELLRDEGGLTDGQVARVTRLIDASAMMSDIVNRMFDVPGPDDLVIKPIIGTCDLDGLIRRCRGVTEEIARTKNLHLTWDVIPSIPRFLRLDESLVERVLLNLLSNAVKFTARGAISLRITGDATRPRFEVADSGAGIPEAKRHRLFREGDRLDASAAVAPGTGMGLAISDRLVKAMGGTIGYQDNPGGGSVFWFEIPVGPPNPTVPDTTNALTQPPKDMVRPLRILLADDMDVTRAVTAGHLRGAGHSVIEVPDGESAMRAARDQVFDVILTDMRMPGWDGIETTRRIRALPAGRGRVPVVLVTGDLGVRHLATSGAAGADGFVMKPFTRDELLTAVEAAARLTPAPPPDAGHRPLIDEAVLTQLHASLGEPAVDGHFYATAGRIESLLALLSSPSAARGPNIRDAVHDLVGVTGLMGLSALSACLRAFETAEDREAAAAALHDTASETLLALRHHVSEGMG